MQVAIIVLSMICASVRADVLELKSGGRVIGKIRQSPENNSSVFVVDLTGGGQIVVPRTQVAHPDTTSNDEDEFHKLARSSPDTVEAHWKLVEWCQQHQIKESAKPHLERILELDPNHAEARTALGFRQKDGQWMKRDDVMASRGLVQYEGRYVTPQQAELMEQQKKNRVAQADWNNKIEQLRRRLTGRNPDKAAEAHAELSTLNDPQAAETIAAALRREEDPDLKRLWIDIAARLKHRASLDVLVHLSLVDPDDDIRHLCVESLLKSGRPGIATPYVRALKDKDNEIVNRAGAALGQIKDRDSIGALIEALVTKHRIKVSDANPDQHAYSFSNDGSAFSFGGKGPQFVVKAVRNRAVLDALLTMSTGASFDFDQDQWRTWLAAQAKANAVDVRRDQ